MYRTILVSSLLMTAPTVWGETGARVRNEPPAQSAPILAVVSREPLGGRTSYPSLGLSGANKANGLEHRFRESVPGNTPRYVRRDVAGMSLTIAEPTADGWLGFYRSDADGATSRNSRFHAALYRPDGSMVWNIELNPFLSRTTRLEIQDVRYRGGRLYFNEACQSYSREAGGRCSSLVRVDPVKRRVDWRSRTRVSNNIFIFSGPYIVAGYGFTAEPDSLFLVSPESGRVVASRVLDTAHRYLEERGGQLRVVTTGNLYTLQVRQRR